MTSAANVVGNHYDKYGTRNPIARKLMSGFLDTVTELYRGEAPDTVLEVGCGEGHLAHHLVHQAPRPRRFEACDLSLSRLAPDLDPLISFQEASAYELPFENGAFDLVICCEVLEHLETPRKALRELARVSRRAVLLSTPREPLWRALNMARGKYLSELGNTPGHIQHFSGRQLVRLASSESRVIERRSPIPWTVLLCRPQ